MIILQTRKAVRIPLRHKKKPSQTTFTSGTTSISMDLRWYFYFEAFWVSKTQLQALDINRLMRFQSWLNYNFVCSFLKFCLVFPSDVKVYIKSSTWVAKQSYLCSKFSMSQRRKQWVRSICRHYHLLVSSGAILFHNITPHYVRQNWQVGIRALRPQNTSSFCGCQVHMTITYS